ncbi:MAG: hypothetical protein O9342_10345 [Beijerinckiaceae bacterium]|nr:hypothetical protein [Beijerinckiaceae bacterium]
MMRKQRVTPGLFVLRYSTANTRGVVPSVLVEVEDAAAARLVHDSNATRPVLSGPGSGLVVIVEKETELRLTVVAGAPGGSLDAQVSLERIVTTAEAAHPGAASEAVASERGPALIGHVARRGDIKVGNGNWICGPEAPMAIEGLQILWPEAPEGVDILLSAVVGTTTRRPQPPVRIGHFAGTRQKASPLVGLTLNLTGAATHLYSLTVEALFLGSPIVTKTGPYIELSGPTGMEPLVGLRLKVSGPDLDESVPASIPAKIEAALPNPAQWSGENKPFARDPVPAAPASSGNHRVRVFRAPRAAQPSPLSVD